MKKLLIISVLVFGLLIVFQGEVVAQCAMCKATLEANAKNTEKYGAGLNTGILYLMVIPYIAASVLGYLWYRNAKLKKGNSRIGWTR